MRNHLLVRCLSALLIAAAPPGPAHRVKDINTTQASPPGIPGTAIAVGNTLYFTVSGLLWKSDGTAAGTQLVEGTGALSSVRFQTGLGGILYFTATDGAHGNELWRTDGTLGGTGIVRDINPGGGDSGIGSVLVFRGELYFAANDGVHGRELWKSDGTKDGTVLAADLNPGVKGSALAGLRASGDRLYFTEPSSFAAGSPVALYTTDGTAGGTRLLREFIMQGTGGVCPGSCLGSPPANFVSFGGLTYFIASDGASGLELWRTDGTTLGTVRVKDICPGACGGFAFTDGSSEIGASLLQAIGGRLVFVANDGVHGSEPWTSDGTEIGTRLLKDIVPGPADSSYGNGLTAVGTAFVFPVFVASNSLQMWRSDGTESGTFPVGSVVGNVACSLQMTSVGDTAFFSASQGSASCGLWKTDAAGSRPAIVSDSVSSPSDLVSFGGALYFTALGPAGFSLWKTDGSAAGTAVVRVLGPENASSNSLPGAEIGESLLFFANDGKDFNGLWRSDGTESGTQPVAPVSLSGGNFRAGGISASFHGSLFFSGNDGVHGLELWRSDGTPAGTRLVKDIAVKGGATFPSAQDSIPCAMTVVGDTLYFGAADSDHGNGLWKTDGTETGTVFIKNISLNCYSGGKPGLVSLGGLAYFSGGQPPNFTQGLWRTDGTGQGTTLVKSVSALNLFSLGSRFLFFGTGAPEGSGLWSSDGTSAGTSIVKSFAGYLTPFASLKDVVLFFAATHDNRIELWRTDGTPGGMVFLADFPFGVVGNAPDSMVSVGDRVFFPGQDAGHGVELWTSDGTIAGTHLVRDINPGEASSYPRNLAAIDRVLLFTARDPIHGEELWRSDGTEEGTFMVQDIAPGPASSSPGNFMKAGSLVYFTADDGESGAELWAMPLSTLDSSPRQKPHRVQDLPWRH